MPYVHYVDSSIFPILKENKFALTDLWSLLQKSKIAPMSYISNDYTYYDLIGMTSKGEIKFYDYDFCLVKNKKNLLVEPKKFDLEKLVKDLEDDSFDQSMMKDMLIQLLLLVQAKQLRDFSNVTDENLNCLRNAINRKISLIKKIYTMQYIRCKYFCCMSPKPRTSLIDFDYYFVTRIDPQILEIIPENFFDRVFPKNSLKNFMYQYFTSLDNEVKASLVEELRSSSRVLQEIGSLYNLEQTDILIALKINDFLLNEFAKNSYDAYLIENFPEFVGDSKLEALDNQLKFISCDQESIQRFNFCLNLSVYNPKNCYAASFFDSCYLNASFFGATIPGDIFYLMFLNYQKTIEFIIDKANLFLEFMSNDFQGFDLSSNEFVTNPFPVIFYLESEVIDGELLLKKEIIDGNRQIVKGTPKRDLIVGKDIKTMGVPEDKIAKVQDFFNKNNINVSIRDMNDFQLHKYNNKYDKCTVIC